MKDIINGTNCFSVLEIYITKVESVENKFSVRQNLPYTSQGQGPGYRSLSPSSTLLTSRSMP